MARRHFLTVLNLLITVKASQRACLPAPYLYVTYHGGSDGSGVNQVHRYSRDGCFLNKVLLHDDPSPLKELRGVLEVGSGESGELMVLNGYKGDSRVMVFSGCDSNNQRTLVRNLTTTADNPLLVHPYGIVLGRGSQLYISAQDTNVVIAVDDRSGNSGVPSTVYAGGSGQDGVRGVAVKDSSTGYVADEDAGVIQFDTSSGAKIGSPGDVASPIGLWYSAKEDILFAGSKDDATVYALDVHTLEKKSSFSHDKLSHPAGIVAFQGTLFVAAQSIRQVMSWDIASGDFLGSFDVDSKDDVEGLALSSC